MFNNTSMKFDRFEADGMAVFKTGLVPPTIILELPHQTPTGMFRAVIWDSQKFTALDIIEGCTFTEAVMLAIEFHPDAELTEAAREQLHEEQLTGVAA